MNKPILILAVLLAAMSCSAACAQSVPLRGIGLLALEAGDSRSASPGGGSALVELPDDGGGGAVGARAQRGSGDGMHAPVHDRAPVPDALPPAAIVRGDPAAPAAATPKRPSYRWQSLVPGAIK